MILFMEIPPFVNLFGFEVFIIWYNFAGRFMQWVQANILLYNLIVNGYKSRIVAHVLAKAFHLLLHLLLLQMHWQMLLRRSNAHQ